jgi:hypothetical protein
MRRDLPPRASLEHLKKQAKDLLDAHRRADPAALARIRDAMPAFSGRSDEAIAAASFALHDAQSTIAREYGCDSWNALRDAVAAQTSSVPAKPSDDFLRAIMPLPFPPEVGEAMREASEKRALTAKAAGRPLPSKLPCVLVRDALFVPRSLGPIIIGRARSRAAVEAALRADPPALALFSQRRFEDDTLDVAAVHPIGCEAYVHVCIPGQEDEAWIVLEGLRWIALERLDDDPRDGTVATVKTPAPVVSGDPNEIAPLAASLRAHVRSIAVNFPDAARMVAIVDAAEPERLADLVLANLPAPVETKARYAEETRLVDRLRMVARLAGVPAP